MTDASPASSLPSPRRASARERDNRRIRILAMVQDGCSNAEIARQEGLSRERVRQIVAEAVDTGGAAKLVHARVQVARLEPALRLAARSVAGGDLGAIDRLLRVLDRLDKYAAIDIEDTAETAGARERLLRKLNTMAERMIAARKAKEAAAAAAGDASSDPEAALDAPQPLEA